MSELNNAPLIHIGYHKTGTTWLQQEVFSHQPGIYTVPRKLITEAFLQPSAFSFDPWQARKMLSALSDHRVLVSMEALSGYPHNGGLNGCLSRDIVSRLQRTFPDAQILVVLRSQPEAIASAYCQYVHRGGTYSPGRYIGLTARPNRPDKVPTFNPDHFEYLPLLRCYREAFGEGAVHVFLYEQFRDERDEFLRRLAETFNLYLPTTDFALSPRRRTSYSPGLLRLSRLLGGFSARDVSNKRYWMHIPGAYWLQRGVMETLNRILPNRHGSNPVRVLGEELSMRLWHRYADSNRRLAEEFELPLQQYCYPGW